LTLIPTLDDLDLPEKERKLEQIRVRRLTLVIQYQKAKSLALSAEYGKVNLRLSRQVEMLEKDIIRLDQLISKCEDRMRQITVLSNEKSFVSDMMQDIREVSSDEDS
jgi:hypothetical protein